MNSELALIELLIAGQEPDCSGLVHRARGASAADYSCSRLFFSVHFLLAAFANPDTIGSRSALRVAGLSSSPMTVQLLLRCRASVHVADFGGERSLHFAAVNEQVVLVKQLLLVGAGPLAPDM